MSTDKKTQVFRIYINAAPQAVWDAITKPEWTQRYGYAVPVEYELKRGGKFRSLANAGMKAMGAPDTIIDGEVIECDPPRRLVQTWRMHMDPNIAKEGFTHLTYELDPGRDGVTRLTVTHTTAAESLLAPMLAGLSEHTGAGGGWPEVLSGLKTVLETGKQLPFQSGPPT
jgi:uncharacterized protein YndB with AHSA1/START domain